MSESHRDDRRREYTLWIVIAADASAIGADEAADRLEATVVGSAEPDSRPASWIYRAPRFDDHIPSEGVWMRYAARAREAARDVEMHRAEIDAIIRDASPRWRIERMPPIDRSLLRMGVAELRFRERPRSRATINGMIELAKVYGSDTTPRFVNGILDQVRKNLGIAFE